MRIFALIAVCLIPQTSPPQAQQPASPSGEVALEQRLAVLVDESLMQKEVRELCKNGPRMGGTESGEKSSKYLRERFAALGLDVRVIEDAPKWCHAESSWKVVASRGTEQHVLASAWPYGFSPTTKGHATLSKETKPGDRKSVV